MRNFHLTSGNGLEVNALRHHGRRDGEEEEEVYIEDNDSEYGEGPPVSRKKTVSMQEGEIRRTLSRVVSPPPLRSQRVSVARVREFTRDMQVRSARCRKLFFLFR